MIALNSDQTLLPYFGYAVEDIQSWKNRYSSNEYLKKLLINTFYREHNVNFMWVKLYSTFNNATQDIDCFNVQKFLQAKQNISQLFNETKLTITQPALMKLINDRKNVGGLNFEVMDNLVLQATSRTIEELEYTYIFSTITNELLFNWIACGMIGVNKNDSFIAVTGFKAEVSKMIDYESSYKFLGLFTSQFLKRNYNKIN